MNSPSPQTSVEEYESILRAAGSQTKPQVIVGGQAVSIWADRYIHTEPELHQYLPFTSKDLDLLGDRVDLEKLAKLTGYKKVEAQEPRVPSAGYLEMPRHDSEIVKVEFLKQLYGATKDEVQKSASQISWKNMTLRVVHPITLLKDKAASAVHLPQGRLGEERQDVRHLKMMVLCVRGFLREQVAGVVTGSLSDRDCLDLVQATFKVAKSADADQAKKKYRINLIDAIPIVELENSKSDRLKNFVKKQLRRG